MKMMLGKRLQSSTDGLRYIYHPSFNGAAGKKAYEGPPPEADRSLGHMPDDLTRDVARRMHYAAWRSAAAANRRQASRWRREYVERRNRIVVGNCKLIHKAVRKWTTGQLADELAGECHVVLIKAVAAYNPWLGIRFSTYAFTCLMRALSRLSQRQANTILARTISLDSWLYGEPAEEPVEESSDPRLGPLDQFLRHESDLLTRREKLVISRRFHLSGDSTVPTLEQVGRDLGLSKERVRQVQKEALLKLRDALLAATPAS